jgi:hypothetical protein
MGITAITRDWGPNNSIVRITTTDDFFTITLSGYLTSQAANIALLNNGAFEWASDDCCLIKYSNGYGFFIPDFTTNFTFIAMQPAASVQNYVATDVPLAAFLTNYSAPVLIVPPVANQVIVAKGWAFEWIYGSAALVGGGAISLEYGNTVHAGGIIATNTIAAADLTGLAADGIEYSNGGLMPMSAFAAVVDKGLYLSNPTADFTVGTGGSAVVHVWYSVITL